MVGTSVSLPHQDRSRSNRSKSRSNRSKSRSNRSKSRSKSRSNRSKTRPERANPTTFYRKVGPLRAGQNRRRITEARPIAEHTGAMRSNDFFAIAPPNCDFHNFFGLKYRWNHQFCRKIETNLDYRSNGAMVFFLSITLSKSRSNAEQ